MAHNVRLCSFAVGPMGTATGVTPLSVDAGRASKLASTIFDPTDGFQNLGGCVGFEGYTHVPSSAGGGSEPRCCVQVLGDYDAEAQNNSTRIMLMEDIVRHMHASNFQADALQG
jgi:hypothetical protein